MNDEEKSKRVQYLFKSLQNDPKSVFYTIINLSNTILKKAKKLYMKKTVFFKNCMKT